MNVSGTPLTFNPPNTPIPEQRLRNIGDVAELLNGDNSPSPEVALEGALANLRRQLEGIGQNSNGATGTNKDTPLSIPAFRADVDKVGGELPPLNQTVFIHPPTELKPVGSETVMIEPPVFNQTIMIEPPIIGEHTRSEKPPELVGNTESILKTFEHFKNSQENKYVESILIFKFAEMIARSIGNIITYKNKKFTLKELKFNKETLEGVIVMLDENSSEIPILFTNKTADSSYVLVSGIDSDFGINLHEMK